MIQPGRKYSAGSGYRYGFNGKENGNEVEGEGNQQDYGMRIYDTRLGRFLSVDPLSASYPSWSPYPFAMNDVIRCIDLDGAEKKIVIHWFDGVYGDGTPKITKTTVYIELNTVYINVSSATGLPTGDGKTYAGTEVYYASPDGRFIQAKTMYEEIIPGGLKPSANYDYTQNVLTDKAKDDGAYADAEFDKEYARQEAMDDSWNNGAWGAAAGKWMRAWLDVTARDAMAPDNALTTESLGGIQAAVTAIGVKGMQGFVVKENASMSSFSRTYQKQISGLNENEAFLLNGVRFDGIKNGVLLEAKGKYAFLLEKGWAQEGLIKQAQSQIKAANGASLEWHFAEKEAAATVQQLFKDRGITGISVLHTPSQ